MQRVRERVLEAAGTGWGLGFRLGGVGLMGRDEMRQGGLLAAGSGPLGVGGLNCVRL